MKVGNRDQARNVLEAVRTGVIGWAIGRVLGLPGGMEPVGWTKVEIARYTSMTNGMSRKDSSANSTSPSGRSSPATTGCDQRCGPDQFQPPPSAWYTLTIAFICWSLVSTS